MIAVFMIIRFLVYGSLKSARVAWRTWPQRVAVAAYGMRSMRLASMATACIV
jgi:hypothetical protein